MSLVSLSVKDRIALSRDTQAVQIPEGCDSVLAAGTEVIIVHAFGSAYTVRTPIGRMYRIDGADADSLGREVVTPPKTTQPVGAVTPEAVENALAQCYDPEIPINIVELGLVYESILKELDDGSSRVDVKMTLTAPGCGMGPWLVKDVETKLRAIPGVSQTQVDLVFDPPWEPSMMSEAARLQTGMM